jgi:hypothetical protein
VDDGWAGKRLCRVRVSLSDREKAELLVRAKADGRSLADYCYRQLVVVGKRDGG